MNPVPTYDDHEGPTSDKVPVEGTDKPDHKGHHNHNVRVLMVTALAFGIFVIAELIGAFVRTFLRKLLREY
jgi:hypothetical protein